MSEKTPVYRKDYKVSAFLVDFIDLQFELHPTNTKVRNMLAIRRNPDAEEKSLHLVLDGERITLQALYKDGQLLTETHYQIDDKSLTIFNVPDYFELLIETTCNPKENTALDGLYLSNGIFCTQCESHGFRKITYYLDRPDVMAKFTTRIIADGTSFPVLLSNGNCIDVQELDNGVKQVTWEDPFKKPCYLFALVAGKLDCHEDYFMTRSGRKITLRIYVEPGLVDKTLHAMAMLKKAMHWDEEKFGREYDLDIFMIVAVSDFNMGAMENKGLNVFNAKYILADHNTATDSDYEAIGVVVAHEYFHNWTGNRITCRDWFQLSLKEGLTVFRDQEFNADQTSRGVARIDQVRSITTTQFAEDRGPLAHPVRPDSYLEMNNFYTVTVYHKGAEVVRMLKSIEGELGFQHGMTLYFDRFDGMAVTCDDFVNAHADANQKDYTQFMRWYSQAGTPELSFSDHYDAASKQYTLHVKQATKPSADGSAKEPFYLPICLALFDQATMQKMAETTLVLAKAEESFVFTEIANKPLPSLLRNFSAPVRSFYPYTAQDRIFLLTHDDDAFNRFDMGQQIFYSLFHEYDDSLMHAYAAALNTILLDPKLDLAMKSRLLSAPTYRELCEQQTIIHVADTIAKKEKIDKTIAKVLSATALTQFIQLKAVNSVGARSLKANCLRLLLLSENAEALALVKDMYHDASNMTDRYNALLLICFSDDEVLRTKALADFHQHFSHDALVIEKWLALEAMVPHLTTLQRVQALLNHPQFDIKNPNKVRSLLGTFSTNNFKAFHLNQSAAYEFLAEQVLLVDQLNPIMSARLVEPLTRFRCYEDAHMVLMRSALQRVFLAPNLSNDLYEIVEKSLK